MLHSDCGAAAHTHEKVQYGVRSCCAALALLCRAACAAAAAAAAALARLRTAPRFPAEPASRQRRNKALMPADVR
jgi:hypothetical protein